MAKATSSELAAGGTSDAGALASSDAAGGDGLPALPDMDAASLVPALLDSDDDGMILEHVSLHDQIKESLNDYIPIPPSLRPTVLTKHRESKE